VILCPLLCAHGVKSFPSPRVCHSNHTSYNLFVATSELRHPYLFCAFLLCCSFFLCTPIHAQQQPAQSAGKQTEPQTPAQIELLETKIRFETNGDSRKEVHTRVKINSELGVRQFARLNFDYNRAFESVDLPLVRITHPSGGTVDILPSAITDNPNPAVLNVPAYQDVRVKSVRILGLSPDDLLEYRVFTTVTHHSLAPDFWLDHSFDRTGVVSQEIFELDLPAAPFEKGETTDSRPSTSNDPTGLTPSASEHTPGNNRSRLGKIYVSPKTPETSKEKIKEGETIRLHYVWNTSQLQTPKLQASFDSFDPDVVVSTFWSWEAVAYAFSSLCYSRAGPPVDPPAVGEKRKEVLANPPSGLPPEEIIYDFVSQKIKTIDLSLGSTGFRARSPSDTLSSGYGTPADKTALFIALLGGGKSSCGFVPSTLDWEVLHVYLPSLFGKLLAYVRSGSRKLYLDLSLEVSPFGLIRSDVRGKDILMVSDPMQLMGHVIKGPRDYYSWQEIPLDLPFASVQKVYVDSSLNADGKLTAKVRYSLRGDNELLLRVAFHQAPKEKWKDLGQLLSLSDGFRGKVTRVTASDPSATREPFTLDYEITMPKFVDWSKKPVHIPALLPQIGLPDPPAKPSPGAAASPIELGTPLEVETHMTLHLPPGTTIQTPTGTSVQRDYATFASQYSAKGPLITASRHINFLLRQVPAERATDYNSFLRAVQNDEAQDFTLDHAASSATDVKPAASAAHPRSTPKP
jgi:uncharacterized protein DUF3857